MTRCCSSTTRTVSACWVPKAGARPRTSECARRASSTSGRSEGGGRFGRVRRRTPEIVETVLQRARTYIYTTAAPAMLAAAVEASLELIRKEEWRRERLRKLVGVLKQALDRRVGLAPSDTPIQPLVLGANARALGASAALRERGILVPAIRPPTVPEGTARLSISLSAAHGEQDVAPGSALREACPSGAEAHV